MLRIFSWLFVLAILPFIFRGIGLAQTPANIPLGVATYIAISDSNVPVGSIVSFSDGTNNLSKVPYDPSMRGVVVANAAIVINNKSSANSYPVVTGGTVEVRISASNGSIKKGDPVTASSVPGVGMKATNLGYILGTALADYSAANPDQIGQIPVLIAIHNSYVVKPPNVSSRLFDIFKLGTISIYESPVTVFKYFIAAIILLISLIFAFAFFGRIANTGVEALGRNPLASRLIQVGIALNVVIAIAIIAAGIAMAYFVIK